MIPTIPHLERATPRALTPLARAPDGRPSAPPAARSVQPLITAGRPALRSVLATATRVVDEDGVERWSREIAASELR